MRRLGARGPCDPPRLVRLSGGTGGTWSGAVPAEPKRHAGPQAQPSWGAAPETGGDQAEVTERQTPAADLPLATSCSMSGQRMLR